MSGGTYSLVCFALEEEAAPFRKIAAGQAGLSILVTGIGRKNAEAAVRDNLAGHAPDRVFTCGFAGGLNPALVVGDVVFFTENEPLRAQLANAGARAATCFCAPRIAVTAADKQELRRTTGADAVEMESGAIQEVCRGRGIPCATVRAISDTADADLPLDFNQMAKADLSLDFGKLARALARSPGRIGALLQLQRQCNIAAAALARTLAAVLAA